MMPVETIPEKGGGENGGRGEFKYDTFDTF
jgi:hypothetical protein